MLMLLLAACRPAPVTPSPPPSPPPATVGALRAPEATSTGRPTPTRTRTATPTPTARPRATSTPDARATANAEAARATVVATAATEVIAPFVSRDGRWRAETIRYDCVPMEDPELGSARYVERLQVHEEASGETWTVDEQVGLCEALGAWGLAGLRFSPGQRYLYYTDGREGAPEGCLEGWYRPIHRVDLESRVAETLGGGPWALGGQRLAALASSDGADPAAWDLVVWDMEEPEPVMRRAVGDWEQQRLGAIRWSPSGDRVALLVGGHTCPPEGVVGASVVIVQPETGALTRHRAASEHNIQHMRWQGYGKIFLQDVEGEAWLLDLRTGRQVRRSVSAPPPTATVAFALGPASARATAGPVPATPMPEPTTAWQHEPPPRPLAPDESGWERQVSPDGRWVAEIGASESVTRGTEGWSGYYRGMRFVDAAAGVTHTLLAAWTEDGIPGLVPTLVGWDADGRHAYVYEQANACCCPHRDTGLHFERVDLETGERRVLASQLAAPRMAPAGDAIAYVPGPGAYTGAGRIEILELGSGAVRASPAFDGLVSEMAWSPSGRRLAVVLVTNLCRNEPGMSTVVLVDRASGDAETLRAPTRDWIWQARWLDEGRLELVSEAGAVQVLEAPE